MPNVAFGRKEAHKKEERRSETRLRKPSQGRQATERPIRKREAHKKRRGRLPGCREEGKAAVRLWGAFEAEPKCLTLPSEAHKKRGARPASCREEGKAAARLWGAFEAEPKCLTSPSPKKRGGRLRPQRGRNRPASCRGAFEGGPKCLTLPSEAHKKRGGRLRTGHREAHKKRGGRLRTGHREAATGLPAAEERLKAVQNA